MINAAHGFSAGNHTVSTLTPPALPTASWAGADYDVLLGNPMAEGMDKGYRQAVWDTAHSTQQKVTPDNKWSIPDGFEARIDDTCDVDVGGHQNLISGETSIGQSAQTRLSIGGDAFKQIAFKASVGFQSLSKGMSAYQNTPSPTTLRRPPAPVPSHLPIGSLSITISPFRAPRRRCRYLE